MPSKNTQDVSLAVLALISLFLMSPLAYADHVGCPGYGVQYFGGNEFGCWGNSHQDMVPRTQALMGVMEKYYPGYFPAGQVQEGYDEEYLYRYYIRSYPGTGYMIVAWWETTGYGLNYNVFGGQMDIPNDESVSTHIYLYHTGFGNYAERLGSLEELEHMFCPDVAGLCILYYMR